MSLRTGPYRSEATDHLTGTRTLELRIETALQLHQPVTLPIGATALGATVCQTCRTTVPCATRQALEGPTT